jgi:[ribosomal protein S5]-alanine N-acetyltransferase
MAGAITETARLIIRPLVEDDVTEIATPWCDPRATRFLGGPRDLGTMRESLCADLSRDPAPSFDLWAVVDKASGAVIGQCGLLDKEIDGRTETDRRGYRISMCVPRPT